MYPLGHYGLALLFAAPAAYLLGRRRGTLFTTVVLLMVLLPDVDLLIAGLDHHGVTHTVTFAVFAAPALGAAFAGLFVAYRFATGADRHPALDAPRVWAWASLGCFVGLGSHVVADVLLVVPVTPLRPFWPFDERVVAIDVWRVGNLHRNVFLLVYGLLTVAIAFWRTDADEDDPRWDADRI